MLAWTDKISDEDILKQVSEKRRMLLELRKKQSRFIPHIVKKGKLENIVTTGKIEVSKDRGRQREKMLDSLARFHSRKTTTELIACIMTPNICRQSTA
jgi:hypothetical protein